MDYSPCFFSKIGSLLKMLITQKIGYWRQSNSSWWKGLGSGWLFEFFVDISGFWVANFGFLAGIFGFLVAVSGF